MLATSDKRQATSDERRATSDQRPATSDQPPSIEFGLELVDQLAQIQWTFLPRLTEEQLSDRLALDGSTLRRWFSREALMSPGHVLMWLRLHGLAYRLRFTPASLEQVAAELGMSSGTNARRSLHGLSGLRPHDVRTVDGYHCFLQLLQAAIGTRRPSARK